MTTREIVLTQDEFKPFFASVQRRGACDAVIERLVFVVDDSVLVSSALDLVIDQVHVVRVEPCGHELRRSV